MGLFFQHDERLCENIRKIGCEYLCGIAATCFFASVGLPVYSANAIWKTGLLDGWIDKDQGLFTPLSYIDLFNIVFRCLGCDELTGDQVGSILFGKITFWKHWNSNRFTYVIRRVMDCRGNQHSMLLDRYFRTIYNPLPMWDWDHIEGDYLLWLGDRKTYEKYSQGPSADE